MLFYLLQTLIPTVSLWAALETLFTSNHHFPDTIYCDIGTRCVSAAKCRIHLTFVTPKWLSSIQGDTCVIRLYSIFHYLLIKTITLSLISAWSILTTKFERRHLSSPFIYNEAAQAGSLDRLALVGGGSYFVCPSERQSWLCQSLNDNKN